MTTAEKSNYEQQEADCESQLLVVRIHLIREGIREMLYFFYILRQKWVLISLLVINALGTVYGFYWYKWQLVDTPLRYLLFVPDSPTASLLFVFVLIAFLYKKHIPLFEALAAVTLVKYGVWAVCMNVAGGAVTGSLHWGNVMLIFSHAGMAVEGLLYAPFYRFRRWHLVVASIWILHDVIIDYVFGMMPRYPALAGYESLIGYATFWLSLMSIGLIYFVTLRSNSRKISL